MLATNRARGIPTTIKTKKTVLAANSGAGTPTGTPRESEIMLPRSENRGAKLQAAGNRSWHVRSAASRRRRTAPAHGTPAPAHQLGGPSSSSSLTRVLTIFLTRAFGSGSSTLNRIVVFVPVGSNLDSSRWYLRSTAESVVNSDRWFFDAPNPTRCLPRRLYSGIR